MALDGSPASSSSSQTEWVLHISQVLEDELKSDLNVAASVFQVPSSLRAVNPQAYTPQLIGLGPYHHLRPDLLHMEKDKVAAAKRFHQRFQGFQLHQRIDELLVVEPFIRACYHKFLDPDATTLLWILAIDALFLYELIWSHSNFQSGMELDDFPIRASHLMPVDSSGRKLARDAILRDAMMLENQIPMFLLQGILVKAIESSNSSVDDYVRFLGMSIDFCKSLSPLKVSENHRSKKVLQPAHLLDLLYHLIVPVSELEDYGGVAFKCLRVEDEMRSETTQLLDVVLTLNIPCIQNLRQPISLILGFLKMPWSKLVSALSPASGDRDISRSNAEDSASGNKAPLVDDILIPTVSCLRDAGMKFKSSSGGISDIKFKENEATFYLPVIELDVNSEVIIRNLVAYEAMTEVKSLVLARYAELMNGIIETTEDVKLLRDSGVIISHLNNDEEVAKLFNGMSKSVGLTDASDLDKTIKDVKKYYNGSNRIKMRRFMRNCWSACWKTIKVVVAVLFLALMALQTFCSVYSCPRIFIKT